MIASTSNPRVWRIEFDTIHSDYTKTGVVCYLYLIDAGIRVYYSHHVAYSRQIPKGPWSPGTIIRQSLSGALRATIESSLFFQVWSQARTDEIQIWPGELGRESSVGEVNLGL